MTDGPTYEFDSTGSATQILTADEAEGLRERHRDAPEDHSDTLRVEATAGRFRFAHDRSDVERGRGELLRPTQTGRIRPFGRPMWVACERLPDDGLGKLVVREANFDFVLDAASTLFSAGDRADDNRDIPVATEEADRFNAREDATAWETNPDGNPEFRFVLDPPTRASEVTLHVNNLPNFAASDEVRATIRFGFGVGSNGDNDPVTVRGWRQRDAYRAVGPTGQVFVTADVASNERIQTVLEYLGPVDSAREVNVNALVR